jgi:hypothetical protein
MMCSGNLWCLYGFLQDDYTIMAPNVSALICGGAYTYIFHQCVDE